MQLQPESLETIRRRMDVVKGRSSAGFVTNYFQQEMESAECYHAATNHSVVFLDREFDFCRLYFLTTNLNDLAKLLSQIQFSDTLVASCLVRKPNEPYLAAFLGSGFRPLALFRRMTNVAMRVARTNASLQFASAADADEIHEALFRVFNKHTERLPSKPRLARLIEGRQVIVNRREGSIQGGLVFQVQGKRVNLNYLFNSSSENLDLLSILLNFYGLMSEQGIRSGFLWIDSANTQVIKLHESFGWRFDGLTDNIFLRTL